MKELIKSFMCATGSMPTFEEMSNDLYIKSQLELVEKLVEEVLEFKESLLERDYTNSVKELIDIKYVLSQCEIVAEVAGVDVNLAEALVCDNNDEKYSTSYDFVEAKLLEWRENDHWFAAKLWISESVSELDGQTYYCLKDDNNKVRKFVDFPKVDLSECIPKEMM